MEESAAPRRRGPQKKPTKTRVSIRLDQAVVDGLREIVRLAPAKGGWQTEANRLLAEAVQAELALRQRLEAGRRLAEGQPWAW